MRLKWLVTICLTIGLTFLGFMDGTSAAKTTSRQKNTVKAVRGLKSKSPQKVIQPKHGGILKSLGTGYVELTIKQGKIQVFVYGKDLEFETTRGWNISASLVDLANPSKVKKIELKNIGKEFIGNFVDSIKPYSEIRLAISGPISSQASRSSFKLFKVFGGHQIK